MISNRIYKIFEILVNPAVKHFSVFNYSWNPKQNLFENLSQGTRKPKLYYFNLCLVVIWLLFDIVQSVRFYTARDFNSFVFLASCPTALSVVTLCICLCTIWDESFFESMNHIIFFLRQINCKLFQTIYYRFIYKIF